MWPIAANLGVVAWGMALVLRLQPRGNGRVLYALAFGPGVGLGVLSLIVFFWRVSGLPRPTALTITAVATGLWVLLGFVRAHEDSAASSVVAARQWPLTLRIVAAVACAISILIALAAFYVSSERQSTGAWDAVAMWNVRARFLFAGYDFFQDTQQRVVSISLPYRPLLLPGAVAGQAMLLGGEDPGIGMLTALAFTAALGVLVFALVRGAASVPLALLAVALTFSARPLVHWAPGQMADVPVAYFLLASAGALASLRQTGLPSVHPALAGFTLGMLVWVKDEGLVLAAILLLITAASTLWKRGLRDWNSWRPNVLPFVVATLPGMLAVLIYQVFWAPHLSQSVLQGDWFSRLLSPQRWSMPIAEVASMLFGWSWGHDTGWGLGWAFIQGSMLLALCYHTRDSIRLLSHLAVLIFLVSGCWILTYTLTHHPQVWHIGSSLERAVVQVYPTMVVGALIALDRSSTFGRPSNAPLGPP